MPSTALRASGARKIQSSASSARRDSIGELLVALDKKIRLACAHGLLYTEFYVGYAFLSEQQEMRVIRALFEDLKKRDFRIQYSVNRKLLRVSWKG